ncbi:MAG: ExbD/TolR family protein [Gemmatimonadota bacterium]
MSFGGFERGRSPSQPMAEINVTPLVDVMLVLLVIFIITAPLLTYALKLDLPDVKAAPASSSTEPVRLSIDASGVIFLDAQPIEADALRLKLGEVAARTPVPEVQLRADKSARFERVALVMSLAQEAGLTRIGFVTEPPAEAAKRP